MLFGPCTQNAVASFLPATSLLCSGGAGFITAMMATLATNARTAPAKTLGGEVPVVDTLAVRMVTDNIVIQFVPSEKRDGLTIERRSGNTKPDIAAAPHSQWRMGSLDACAILRRRRRTQSCLSISATRRKCSTTTWRSSASIRRSFDAMVLSHGHYDHFGGMVGFLKAHESALKKKMPFYVGGEDCFCLRRNPGGNFGALDRKAILDADLTLMMASEPAIVADHAFTTGRIGQTSFEQPLRPTTEIVGIFDGFGCFPEKMPADKNTGAYIPDDFEHEIRHHLHGQGQGPGGAHFVQPSRRDQYCAPGDGRLRHRQGARGHRRLPCRAAARRRLHQQDDRGIPANRPGLPDHRRIAPATASTILRARRSATR